MRITDVTIMFTFYCAGECRRNYLRLCLLSIFGKTNSNNIPILVIDGSPKKEALLNRVEFNKLNNVKYIIDETANPFKRCQKYLKEIKTPFVFRILEDCILVNFYKSSKEYLLKEMSLLKNNLDIQAIQYPILDETKFVFEKNKFYFEPINFYNHLHQNYKGFKFYDRSLDGEKYSYLCNNLLYKTDFFIKHWKYITMLYCSHNHAESGIYDHTLLKLFNYNFKLRIISHIFEKYIFRKYLLNKIAVSESCQHIYTFHLGYYSTDSIHLKSQHNKITKNDEGVKSIHDHLEIFKTLHSISKIKFLPHKNA